jgi:hypothetical protein
VQGRARYDPERAGEGRHVMDLPAVGDTHFRKDGANDRMLDLCDLLDRLNHRIQIRCLCPKNGGKRRAVI